ncbi:Ni/Fe hydrogenase subunit gamma [Marinicaulis flavus]|uniref:Ni/Fe hydrogenase subunit gamma n=2 Tax=Hyphococcus luteus TaxID=2058213 RepID=A0A2S7K0D5_9PROT|nr:Ni/Fe hydrogenase subunit gamma [Marinicaulis flavus]
METADTATLALEPKDRANAMPFEPGQFNMLYAFGGGEVPISISGDPRETGRIIHTIRAVGSVTRPLIAHERGALVGLRGPFGAGWPVEAARGKDLLIIAGGLGLAPLRPAILDALHRRSAFQRIVILYGAKDPDSLLFLGDIADWRGRPDVGFDVTVDRAGQDWHGNIGVILRLIKAAHFDPANAVAFICGPEVMMRLAADELMARDLPQDSIYVSLERNMKCAFARCGHCQFGPHFVCKDGPVFRLDRIRALLQTPEI